MKLSKYAIELLIQLEGLKTKVYKDSGGEPTIGVGHLLTKSERRSGKIRLKTGHIINIQSAISRANVIAILRNDLIRFRATVRESVKVKLSQNQFETLVIFSFNVGVAAFKTSTLLKRLNQGHYDQVPTQLKRWKHDNGKVVKGLINRRKAEIKHWNKKSLFKSTPSEIVNLSPAIASSDLKVRDKTYYEIKAIAQELGVWNNAA